MTSQMIRYKIDIISQTSMSSVNISIVLSEIDPSLLTGERSGVGKKVYTLSQVQNFARRLGIPVGGKNKQYLVDNIRNVLWPA